jgi:phosphomannomutase
MVPFTISHYGAVAGIMITASHNPKDDNGYKVYWDNGCQIISPHDAKISSAIMNNLGQGKWNIDLMHNNHLVVDPSETLEHYFTKIKGYSRYMAENSQKHLTFCYTAMHGVGAKFAKMAFERIGLHPFHSVPVQNDPDPDFPTVKFPNPEEHGALVSLFLLQDIALDYATNIGAEIVLANDPDADRFAIAEYQTDKKEWYAFTGNEIGVILAYFVYFSVEDQGDLAFLTTVVSSHMLEEMAKQLSVHYSETLTGFKWLGNQAIRLQDLGKRPIFAYEEAIGFMCYDIVHDKDGISALAFMSELVNHVYGQGKTLKTFLDELYEKFGYFVSNNHYFSDYI